MFRRVAVRLEELTPELARKFSEMPHLAGERRRKPRRLADILKWIRDGEFAGPTWSVATLKGDREAIQYRANGQHTSYVLSHLPDDVAFPEELMVAIEIYELLCPLVEARSTRFFALGAPAARHVSQCSTQRSRAPAAAQDARRVTFVSALVSERCALGGNAPKASRL